MMSKREKERLMQKLAEVLARGDIAEEQAVEELTQVIRKSYDAGMQTQISPLAIVSPLLTEKSVNTAKDSMKKRVGMIWAMLGEQLSSTILDGIKAGKSYEAVSKDVEDLLKNGWGEIVDFDNRGRKVKKIHVDPFTGKMTEYTHKIKEPISLSAKSYATTLSQTVVHESWNKARDDQFDSVGVEKFVYSAVADAATRSDHLAMHGKIIERHSREEELADKLMKDYNCRCLKLPHRDDPEFDTPQKVYDEERIKAAIELRKVTPDGTVDADTLDAIIGKESREELKARVKNECAMKILGSKSMNYRLYGIPTNKDSLNPKHEAYKEYIDKLADLTEGDKNTQARLRNLGMSGKDAAQAMTKILRDNFAWSRDKGYWSYNHIMGGHGTEAFTLADVVAINDSDRWVHIDYVDNARFIIEKWTGKDFLKVCRGNDPEKIDKVVTAYILKQKSAMRIISRSVLE